MGNQPKQAIERNSWARPSLAPVESQEAKTCLFWYPRFYATELLILLLGRVGTPCRWRFHFRVIHRHCVLFFTFRFQTRFSRQEFHPNRFTSSAMRLRSKSDRADHGRVSAEWIFPGNAASRRSRQRGGSGIWTGE